MNTSLKLENRLAWVYLFNLGFFLLPLGFVDYSAVQLAIMLAALAAFIAVYFWAYRCSSEDMWLPILIMVAIACAMTPLNGGSIALFAYAGFFIGFAYRTRTAIFGIGALLALLVVFDQVIGVQWQLFLQYGVVVVAGVSIFGIVERSKRLNRQREQRSNAEIERLASTLERERIARDLHDVLGHTLSSIILKADLAKELLKHDDTAAAKTQLHELASVARQSLSQVRQSVAGYRHRSLQEELDALKVTLAEAGFTTRVQGAVPKLTKVQEQTLIFALKELATNALRHSRGKHFTISFRQNATEHVITVADDGPCEAEIIPGNGLTGLAERLAEQQGDLAIERDGRQYAFIIRMFSTRLASEG